MLELYHADPSVCAQKVRFALALKGIEWVDRRMVLEASEQYSPEYRKLNPKAVVPTLVHDGNAIRESTVICEYIEDAFPEPSLRPASLVERAEMRRWAKIPDDEVQEACDYISQAGILRQSRLANPNAYYDRLAKDPDRKRADRNKRLFERGFDDAGATAALFVYARLLEEMQDALADGRPWLVGREISLADVGIAPYVNRLYVSGLSPMWADKPSVATWFERVRQLPAFAQSFAGSFMPRFGNEPAGEGVWSEVRPILEHGEAIA